MMKIKSLFFALFLVSACVSFGFAQTTLKKTSAKTEPAGQPSQAIRISAAYAEVLLRKTELTAELEKLLVTYTEEYPKVVEFRLELNLLQKELNRLLTVNVSDSSRLTLALGKLLVQKAEFEADLVRLQKQYSGEHPEVRRAKRKVEIFEQAINEILK